MLLGAADTFRAAAVDQLTIWSERVGVPIVKKEMGSDPASVAFDTVNSAVAISAKPPRCITPPASARASAFLRSSAKPRAFSTTTAPKRSTSPVPLVATNAETTRN